METNSPIQITDSLTEIHSNKLLYSTEIGEFYVLGSYSQDFAALRCTICFECSKTGIILRNKLDLYEPHQIANFCELVCAKTDMTTELFEVKLFNLTKLLESHREQKQGYGPRSGAIENAQHTLQHRSDVIQFLALPNLLARIDKLIEQIGVFGKPEARRLGFVVVSSYRNTRPLHGLVHGSNRRVLCAFMKALGNLVPPEDYVQINRFSSKGLFHFAERDLSSKALLIHDVGGISNEAKFALLELQQNKSISSALVKKDLNGNFTAHLKVIRSHFASLSSFIAHEEWGEFESSLIALDLEEGDALAASILGHEKERLSGEYDQENADYACEFLRNCIRALKPLVVVNKYAKLLHLKAERQLNPNLETMLFECINQIAFIHQFQRKLDNSGRLLVEFEDVEMGLELFFNNLIWRLDELNIELRNFFAGLKLMLAKTKKNTEAPFTAREARHYFNFSRSRVDRNMAALRKLGYIHVASGTANKGFYYAICFDNGVEKLRAEMKSSLLAQLNQLRVSS